MPANKRDGDGLSERRAHQQRELDVAHAHSGRVREAAANEEERGTESCQRPLGLRLGRGLRQRARSRAAGTTIRFGTIRCVEVGRRHSHEHGAEERGDGGLARQAEPP